MGFFVYGISFCFDNTCIKNRKRVISKRIKYRERMLRTEYVDSGWMDRI